MPPAAPMASASPTLPSALSMSQEKPKPTLPLRSLRKAQQQMQQMHSQTPTASCHTACTGSGPAASMGSPNNSPTSALPMKYESCTLLAGQTASSSPMPSVEQPFLNQRQALTPILQVTGKEQMQQQTPTLSPATVRIRCGPAVSMGSPSHLLAAAVPSKKLGPVEDTALVTMLTTDTTLPTGTTLATGPSATSPVTKHYHSYKRFPDGTAGLADLASCREAGTAIVPSGSEAGTATTPSDSEAGIAITPCSSEAGTTITSSGSEAGTRTTPSDTEAAEPGARRPSGKAACCACLRARHPE